MELATNGNEQQIIERAEIRRETEDGRHAEDGHHTEACRREPVDQQWDYVVRRR